MKRKKEERFVEFYCEVHKVCNCLMDGFIAHEKNRRNTPSPTMCAKAALTELRIVLKKYEDLVYGELPF